MAKPIGKSIRLSQEVFDIVESAPGKGFNEKFEKLVLDYKLTIPTRQAQLKSIENRIQIKKRELEKLNKLAEKVSLMTGILENIADQIPKASNLISEIHDSVTQEFDQARAAADAIEIQRFNDALGKFKAN